MFYTYVLFTKDRHFYIGYSQNLTARFHEHQTGKVTSTKLKLPVTLLYYEACLHQFDALKREKYLKSGPGRKYLRNRLRIYLASAS